MFIVEVVEGFCFYRRWSVRARRDRFVFYFYYVRMESWLVLVRTFGIYKNVFFGGDFGNRDFEIFLFFFLFVI